MGSLIRDDAAGAIARLRAAGCVYAEEEAALLITAASGDPSVLERMLRRRESGEPLEQILGWAEFRGLRLLVAPGVFVPRARSGLLAERVLAMSPPPRLVVDLCCGNGAIAASLRTGMPEVEMHAADLDPAAVEVAQRNLEPLGVTVHEGDLYAALPAGLRGRVGVIVANAPYVPSAEIANMPSEARDHEHPVALDGGPDGLDVQRRVIAEATEWLAAGGALLVETSVRQAPVTAALFRAAGFTTRVRHSDELDATIVEGWKSGFASRLGE